MAKLTAKQQTFVEEYLIDLNATQAAIRAGYSAKNADKIGSELLGKTRVAEAVSMAMAERSRRTGINQDRIQQEIAFLEGFLDQVEDPQTRDILRLYYVNGLTQEQIAEELGYTRETISRKIRDFWQNSHK